MTFVFRDTPVSVDNIACATLFWLVKACTVVFVPEKSCNSGLPDNATNFFLYSTQVVIEKPLHVPSIRCLFFSGSRDSLVVWCEVKGCEGTVFFFSFFHLLLQKKKGCQIPG